MSQKEGTRLKATGERVQILFTIVNPKTGGDLHCCVLPPQQPGHNKRLQYIRPARLI